MANDLADQILDFVSKCRQPAVLEAGDEPLPLEPGRFSLDVTGGRLYLEAWNDKQYLTRRLTGVITAAPGRLELEIQRIGGKRGSLLLVDWARAASTLERKARRLQLRERFRRMLARQFPGWKITTLSAEADLEHTLSPAYARATVRRGASVWAAIAAADAPTADAVLTFGLIWLDYVRRHETRGVVEGLCLLLPAGKELATCLRLRWLNPRVAQFVTYLYEDDWEELTDWRRHGNLDTRLEPAAARNPARLSTSSPEAWLEAQVRRDISQLDPNLRRDPVYGQVPTWAAADRGVVDLLAIDYAGRLAVVELKAAADPNLPMQALDYWLRVAWHSRQGDFLRLGYFAGLNPNPHPYPRLLLIAPALAFHSTTETILRCLAKEVEVERVGVAVKWQQPDVRVLFRLRGAHTPY
jgi:hypothetical protein